MFKDLIVVAHQIKHKLPIELWKYFIGDLPKIKKADVIVTILDYYEATRCNIKPINNQYDVSISKLSSTSYIIILQNSLLHCQVCS